MYAEDRGNRPVQEITGAPFHPIPKEPGFHPLGEKEYRIKPIPGNVPDLGDLPAGCSFFPRCPYGQPRCEMELPPLEEAGEGRQVRCFFWREIRTLVKEEGGINSELSFAAD